jgi:hypothetical protein
MRYSSMQAAAGACVVNHAASWVGDWCMSPVADDRPKVTGIACRGSHVADVDPTRIATSA